MDPIDRYIARDDGGVAYILADGGYGIAEVTGEALLESALVLALSLVALSGLPHQAPPFAVASIGGGGLVGRRHHDGFRDGPHQVVFGPESNLFGEA